MFTATQLIRQAALATGPIEVKPGKVLTYADPLLTPTLDADCWLCGGDVNGIGMSAQKGIKDTFTDTPRAKAPYSQSLCSGCAFCLSVRELRNYSILATETRLRHPNRADWRSILLDPPEPPFVACLAVSGQKHLSFKGVVNLDRDIFTVLLEEQEVEVIPSQLADLLAVVETAYGYFTKDEISTGRYGQNRIRQCGLARWEALEAAIEPWRGKRLFNLALFIAQKPPEHPKEQPKPEVKPDAVPAANAGGGQAADPATGQLRLEWG